MKVEDSSRPSIYQDAGSWRRILLAVEQWFRSRDIIVMIGNVRI